VERQLFEACFVQHLKRVEKSVILMTNHVQYLSTADCTMLMSEGKTVHQGTFEKLISDRVDFTHISEKEKGHRMEKILRQVKNGEEDLGCLDDFTPTTSPSLEGCVFFYFCF
jgi:ABC-type multidrug transport system ATPase subunit